jgi:hypothetical protein
VRFQTNKAEIKTETFMKKTLLILFSLVAVVGSASASNNYSYTAAAAPGSAGDGTDQNSSPVSVWTLLITPGATGSDGAGSYFGTQDTMVNAWQIYSYQNSGTGNGGSADAETTFTGGALSIGQTVSINFNMRATDPGKYVGVSLLNSSGNAITFEIPGGGPGNYFYTDAGSTLADAGSMTYQYQSPFNIAFTVTGAGAYTAVAGSDTWNGTFSGSLLGMDVFNHGAGNASDIGFNNLTITSAPEPSILAMCATGGALLVGCRRHFKRA